MYQLTTNSLDPLIQQGRIFLAIAFPGDDDTRCCLTAMNSRELFGDQRYDFPSLFRDRGRAGIKKYAE